MRQPIIVLSVNLSLIQLQHNKTVQQNLVASRQSGFVYVRIDSGDPIYSLHRNIGNHDSEKQACERYFC